MNFQDDKNTPKQFCLQMLQSYKYMGFTLTREFSLQDSIEDLEEECDRLAKINLDEQKRQQEEKNPPTDMMDVMQRILFRDPNIQQVARKCLTDMKQYATTKEERQRAIQCIEEGNKKLEETLCQTKEQRSTDTYVDFPPERFTFDFSNSIPDSTSGSTNEGSAQ